MAIAASSNWPSRPRMKCLPVTIETVPAKEIAMYRLLNDRRDLPHLRLYLQCALLFLPAAAVLYGLGHFPWWLGVVYVLVWNAFGDRFTMSYHCTLHRRLFKKQYRACEILLDWML